MKNTIKILSIVGTALFALGTSANAEEGDKKGKQRKLPPEIVEKFDTDGDGKLNEDERQAAREARKAKMEERRAEILEKFDTDGSGKIDTDEEKAAVREAMKERRGEDGPRGKGKKGGPGGKGKGGPGKGGKDKG